MKRIRIVLALSLFVLTGCHVRPHYVGDRVGDLGDVLSLSTGMGSEVRLAWDLCTRVCF